MSKTDDFDPRKSYGAIADIYDDDMGRNMPFDDVGYYVARASEIQGPCLELGCGTGRITLPLLAKVWEVMAVDISPCMMAVLQRKLRVTDLGRCHLQLVHMDIRHWALRGKFSTVLCPYSLFTYLVEPEDQHEFLSCVRATLSPGGCFIVDAFIPDSTIESGKPILDYRRQLADGTVLERRKLLVAEPQAGVSIIRRSYSIWDTAGNRLRSFATMERIRYFFPDEIRLLVERNGFRIEAMDWDYGLTNDPGRARFVTLRCRVH